MPEPETRHLDGALVRAARRTRGLTQEGLAQEVGMTWSTIQRIEAGEVDPLTSTALALARALGCPVEALVRGTGMGNTLEQAKGAASGAGPWLMRQHPPKAPSLAATRERTPQGRSGPTAQH